MKKLSLLFAVYTLLCTFDAHAATRDSNTVNRTPNQNISRTATVVSRTAATPTRATTSRTAAPVSTSRAATSRSATTSGARTRNAQTSNQKSSVRNQLSRAAAAPIAPLTVFGTGYNDCRDAYFTCMDQFCATADDSYRRCTCSARLTEVQGKERALAQTAQQLTDFKNLNIESISKTSGEIQAMLNASGGEYAIKDDNTVGAMTLANIGEVLRQTKSAALSTAGTLDIAGNIGQIWASRDFAAGADIANLTGEHLYNAVHAQCTDMAASYCGSKSAFDMVVSAYGMYIENDCSILANALDTNTRQAKSEIRQTEREMNLARLENYDVHNATAINECIAQVRRDITADTACGTNYVHCLDITGKYLSRDTGAPIYTTDFYHLMTATSLAGDVLTNQTNRMLVMELNRKREFAKRGLDTCRDIADEVWDEFMRQAISEIHQGQQQRIRQVKDECIGVVNQCYDTTTKQLRDFTNTKEQLLLGARMELSEQMCTEQLNTCSNLYGGGPQGFAELLRTLSNITDQTIAQNCKATLLDYSRELCTPRSTDVMHGYPYDCRAYTPGEQRHAAMGCYIYSPTATSSSATRAPSDVDLEDCGDFQDSLYNRLAHYAREACMRPSAYNDPIPTIVLTEINSAMDSIKTDMRKALAAECTRLDGTWVSFPIPTDETFDERFLNKEFYLQVSANTKWGYCVENMDAEEERLANMCVAMQGVWNSRKFMNYQDADKLEEKFEDDPKGLPFLEDFYKTYNDDRYGWCLTAALGNAGQPQPNISPEQQCSQYGGSYHTDTGNPPGDCGTQLTMSGGICCIANTSDQWGKICEGMGGDWSLSERSSSTRSKLVKFYELPGLPKTGLSGVCYATEDSDSISYAQECESMGGVWTSPGSHMSTPRIQAYYDKYGEYMGGCYDKNFVTGGPGQICQSNNGTWSADGTCNFGSGGALKCNSVCGTWSSPNCAIPTGGCTYPPFNGYYTDQGADTNGDGRIESWNDICGALNGNWYPYGVRPSGNPAGHDEFYERYGHIITERVGTCYSK